MQKKALGLVVMLLVLLLAACNSTSEPATTDIVAPTAAVAQATDTPATVATEPAATTAPADTASTEADLRTFAIAPDRSEVRFVIDEVLRGNPTTVVGANSGVTGNVTVDVANPANTQISTIEVDAAGFVTDEERRNGAIRRFILQTDANPTITFTPTAMNGLPATAAVGESFDFQIIGDLTILNSTAPVTFDVTATVVSEDELQLTGSSTINRTDFGLSIPSVPFVASVEEEMMLELDLVAIAE